MKNSALAQNGFFLCAVRMCEYNAVQGDWRLNMYLEQKET